MNAFTHASLFSLLSMVITAAPMVAGFAFAWRPGALRLAQVRALTLVAVFATAANLLTGVVQMLVYLSNQPPTNPLPLGQVYGVSAEILVIPFVGFVFLTLAWIGVAIGLRRPFDN